MQLSKSVLAHITFYHSGDVYAIFPDKRIAERVSFMEGCIATVNDLGICFEGYVSDTFLLQMKDEGCQCTLLQNQCQWRTQTTGSSLCFLAFVTYTFASVIKLQTNLGNEMSGKKGDTRHRIHSDCIIYSL